MELSYLISLLLRWMHVLSAITLMGGAIFMRLALLPSASILDPGQHDLLRGEIRRRWAKWVMIASTFLILSGLSNVGLNEVQYRFDGQTYRMLLAVKILLTLPVFYIAMTMVGRSAAAEKVRKNAKFWLSLNLVLATVVVMLGGAMRFADRVPKSKNPPQTQQEILKS